jgi:hypothetical protein
VGSFTVTNNRIQVTVTETPGTGGAGETGGVKEPVRGN